MEVVKLIGIKELQVALKKHADLTEAKQIVKQNGSEMNKKAQRNTENFKGHYEWVKGKGKVFVKPTGTLKRSIKVSIKDNGLTAESQANTEYAGYVEYGTRFMEAQPYMDPAFEDQKEKFKKDMKKLVK